MLCVGRCFEQTIVYLPLSGLTQRYTLIISYLNHKVKSSDQICSQRPSSEKTTPSGMAFSWCWGKDSNLRRRMPADLQSDVFDRFTTPAYFWSRLSGLNRRPTVYKTVALPTELSRRVLRKIRVNRSCGVI